MQTTHFLSGRQSHIIIEALENYSFGNQQEKGWTFKYNCGISSKAIGTPYFPCGFGNRDYIFTLFVPFVHTCFVFNCIRDLYYSDLPIFLQFQPLKSLELTSTIDSADNLTQRKISHQQFEEKKVVIDQQCTSHPIFVPNSCQEIKYFFMWGPCHNTG